MTEIYLAQVIAYREGRVAIKRLCHTNITATPTLARWSDFSNFKPYVEDLPSSNF